MFQNHRQPLNERHAPIPHTTLGSASLASPRPETADFAADSRHLQHRRADAGIAATRRKELWLPDRKPLPEKSESATPAIIYRNSSECRPYHSALHAFEASQFGNDFSCDSKDFEHWFNAESYFCAAAFSNGDNDAKILSLIAMLFVTEESALEFLGGERSEQELTPFNGNTASPPVIYFSSLAAKSFTQLIPLYKILLKDIGAYKSKYNVAPRWGFSIAATEDGIKYLTNSGFYKTESKNFLNKYAIVKIDCQTAQSKIWTSIFSQPAPISASGWMKKMRADNPALRLRFRSKSIGSEGVLTAANYDVSRAAPAPNVPPVAAR